MIQPEWKRIAGIHVMPDGDIGAVWLAHDKSTDAVHIYDACMFRREVFAVIAEGMNARGRWIPIAWESKAKDVSEKLLERGCNMLYEPIKESQPVAEVYSRDILERMKTGRLKVDKRLSEWTDEFRRFYRQDSQVPMNSNPLMSATRHAVSQLKYARRQSVPAERKTQSPRIAII